MKKHVQIRDSYSIWLLSKMKDYVPTITIMLVIEWWIHNIGYYVTLPFISNAKVQALNKRFKHVDLMVKED